MFSVKPPRVFVVVQMGCERVMKGGEVGRRARQGRGWEGEGTRGWEWGEEEDRLREEKQRMGRKGEETGRGMEEGRGRGKRDRKKKRRDAA